MTAALTLLGMLDGGEPPSMRDLEGLTPGEQAEADSLYAGSLEMSRETRERRVAVLAYLVRHGRTGATISQSIHELSDDQLAELSVLAEEAPDGLR